MTDSVKEKFSHCECREKEPMAKHTTFRIGGPADTVVYPENRQTVSDLIVFCKDQKIPLTVLGKGSNVLVSDEGIRGVVAILDARFGKIHLEDETTVRCEAGASMAAVGAFAEKNGLTGFEFGAGIPGTVGGALYMNAGAYGGEMKDVVLSAEYLDADGVFHTVRKEDMKLGYRTSIFADRFCCITEVTLQLKKGDPAVIHQTMAELMQKRISKQPLNFPSAGSTFKRPEGNFAGALIEQSGLKGTRVGDAQVSEKHAGFIINRGNATSEEVRALIFAVQQKVFKDSGILLECEVKML